MYQAIPRCCSVRLKKRSCSTPSIAHHSHAPSYYQRVNHPTYTYTSLPWLAQEWPELSKSPLITRLVPESDSQYIAEPLHITWYGARCCTSWWTSWWTTTPHPSIYCSGGAASGGYIYHLAKGAHLVLGLNIFRVQFINAFHWIVQVQWQKK